MSKSVLHQNIAWTADDNGNMGKVLGWLNSIPLQSQGLSLGEFAIVEVYRGSEVTDKGFRTGKLITRAFVVEKGQIIGLEAKFPVHTMDNIIRSQELDETPAILAKVVSFGQEIFVAVTESTVFELSGKRW